MAEYIDKDKLLEDIEHSVVFTLRPDKPSSINAELRGARKIIDRIQCAPAADVVEVMHGRWMAHHIEPDDYKNDYDVPYDEKDLEQWGCYCSECGIDALLNGNEKEVTSDYCPNCGAKMDGGANDAAD